MSIALLEKMYDRLNRRYFRGALERPPIELGETDEPGASHYCLGWHMKATGVIRINRQLLAGTHPLTRRCSGYREGILLCVEDLLLHEMAHQMVAQVYDRQRPAHGVEFYATCLYLCQRMDNLRKRWRQALTLSDCRFFPDQVRPKGYYGCAVKLDRAFER